MGKVREIRKKRNKFMAPNYAPPMFVQRFAKGEWVYGLVELEDGSDGFRAMLDLNSNYSATSLGHNHPQLVALRNKRSQENRVVQISQGMAISEEAVELAEKISRLAGMDMALYKNVGTEGFDLAVAVARRWAYRVKGVEANRAEIIVCKGCFHGRSFFAKRASSDPAVRKDFGPLGPDWDFRKIPFGDLDALEKTLKARGGKYIAAFIVEPIQAEAGVIIPPDGYIREARWLCRKYNVLFLLDEIQTGLGRTGKLFCWQHDGYEESRPDGMILGKALGGGLAKISLLATSREVLELLDEGSEGSTFGGDPESCAIASKVLDIVSMPSFLKRVEALGEEFIKILRAIDSPAIKEVRGRGLLVAMEITPGYNVRYIWEKLFGEGILSIKRKNAIGFSPPLNINEHNLLVYGVGKIKKVFDKFS